MGASARRDLYLQIGGSADGLETTAKKAARSVLALGTTADDVAAEMQKAFDDLTFKGVDQSAKDLERSLDRTMASIQQNMRRALAAPTPAAANDVLNVAGAERAARAAEAEAATMRKLTDATATWTTKSNDAGAAQRLLIVGLAAGTVQAEEQALALRTNATLMAELAAEAGIVADADEESMKRVAHSSGQAAIAKAELMHVARSASDSYAAGLPIGQIITMELGRVAEAAAFFGQSMGGAKEKEKEFAAGAVEAGAGALEVGSKTIEAGEHVKGMGGKLAAVGEFMGGPWGMAATLAVSVLVPLIVKIAQTKDALGDEEKKLAENAKQTDIAEQAKRLFARTQDGVTQSTRELTKELDKQNLALRSNAANQNINARGKLSDLQAHRSEDVRGVTTAQSDLAEARKADPGPMADRTARDQYAARIAEAQDKVTAAKKTLADLDKSIAEASIAYERTRIPLAVEQGQHAADPEQRINDLYDRRILLVRATAEEEAKAGKKVEAAVEAKVAGIERERKAAIKAEQERQKLENKTPNNNQIGVDATVADATRIVEGIGGHVTSGYRSHEKQEQLYADKLAGRHSGPVAVPGTSAHERGQAVDVAYGAGITISAIKDAFREAGVAIRQLKDEPGQRVYHVEFGKKGKAGPSAETLEHRQQAAADKAERDRDAFAQLQSRAQEESLRLQRQQVTGYAEGAELDRQQIEAERLRLDAAVQAGVVLRRWSQADADGLIALNDRNAALKKEAIDRAEQAHKLEVIFTADEHARAASDALLQLDLDMATTRKERLAIEQQLLADSQASRRAKLEQIAQDPRTSDDDFAQAEADLARLPAQDAKEKSNLARKYQSPMDAYRDQLKGEVDDAGDKLKVDGLNDLEDGLTSVITRSKTAGQAVRDMVTSMLASLAKLEVEKLFFSVIGLKDGGAVAGFSGGGLPGFAGGGEPSVDNGIIRGPGTGTSDSILAMVGRKPIRVGNGEAIVNERGVRKHWPLIDAINHDRLPAFAGGGLVDPSAIYMRPLPASGSLARPQQVQVLHVVTDKSPYFTTAVQQVAAPLAQAAMIGGSQLAQSEIAADSMTRIP